MASVHYITSLVSLAGVMLAWRNYIMTVVLGCCWNVGGANQIKERLISVTWLANRNKNGSVNHR